MQARNTKSLFHFLTEQMDKLSKGEITIDDANAQSRLASQINNILKYELERAKTQIEIDTHNSNQNFKKIEIRNVESCAFDNVVDK